MMKKNSAESGPKTNVQFYRLIHKSKINMLIFLPGINRATAESMPSLPKVSNAPLCRLSVLL